MSKNDYAILVGISRYADKENLHPLEGPVNDVNLMNDWLLGEQGVPKDNIKKIVTQVNSLPPITDGPPPDDDAFPPIYEEFQKHFLGIVRRADRQGYIRRDDGRLFLYFSGHGFSEKHDRSQHAALYVGNTFIKAGPQNNIYGTYFANWTKDRGLFKEIVLIMDCCRDAEITKVASIPVLPVSTETGVDAKLFQLYAVPLGGKAQECPIPSRNSEVHGLLTHAFLDAVKNAAPGRNQVSTTEIKNYLWERWDVLCGEQPPQKPIPVVPENGEIYFNRNAYTAPPQRFRLKTLKTGDVFEIIGKDFTGKDFTVVARVAIGDTQVEINRDNVKTYAPIENDLFSMLLPPSFYMAEAFLSPGNILRQNFQAGGNDVEL